MREPRQGDLWWADLPQPQGRRPVLVLTRSDAMGRLSNVTVAPLTRTIRYIASEVILTPEQGVRDLSAVTLDNILTIPKATLDRRLAQLDTDTLQAVFAAIRYVFAMPDGPRE